MFTAMLFPFPDNWLSPERRSSTAVKIPKICDLIFCTMLIAFPPFATQHNNYPLSRFRKSTGIGPLLLIGMLQQPSCVFRIFLFCFPAGICMGSALLAVALFPPIEPCRCCYDVPPSIALLQHDRSSQVCTILEERVHAHGPKYASIHPCIP